MKKAYAAFALIASALVITGCNDKVPDDVVDQNQRISRENAQSNARRFANVRFPQVTQIVVDSDSTISKSCRYGDGWATGKLYQDAKVVAIVKCQTNGSGKGLEGCLLAEEFKTKDYGNDDGNCQNLDGLPKFSSGK